MLYTYNVSSAVHQLYLNITGKKILMNTFITKLNIGKERIVETENKLEKIIQNKAWKDENMGKTEEEVRQIKVKSYDRDLNLSLERRKCGIVVFEEI